MAILDSKLLFAEDQAVTTATATDSTNVLDLGAGYDAFGAAKIQDGGISGKLWLNIKVTEAVTSGGSATVTFSLQSSTAADGTFVAAWTSAAIPKATLVAGYSVVRMPIPMGMSRFVKVVITPATADLTAGKFTAWLGLDAETNK